MKPGRRTARAESSTKSRPAPASSTNAKPPARQPGCGAAGARRARSCRFSPLRAHGRHGDGRTAADGMSPSTTPITCRRPGSRRPRPVEPDFAAARQLLNIQRAEQRSAATRPPARAPTPRAPASGLRLSAAARSRARGAPSATRVASSFSRARERTRTRFATFTQPSAERRARRPTADTGSSVRRGPYRPAAARRRVEAGVDDDLLELRKSLEVGRVQPVDFGLRLLHGRTRFQPADLLEVVAVPIWSDFWIGVKASARQSMTSGRW